MNLSLYLPPYEEQLLERLCDRLEAPRNAIVREAIVELARARGFESRDPRVERDERRRLGS